MKIWHPHFYSNKFYQFIGEIEYIGYYEKHKKIKTIFDIKKCIFCEKEKFRISKKYLHEIKNSNNPIRLMNYIPFLIKVRDSITDPNDYYIISKWHTVLGKLNTNILVNNRIKKLK